MKRKEYRYLEPYNGTSYTLAAPWHKCATLKNITADYRATIKNADTLDATRQALAFLGHECRRSSEHAGYVPAHLIGVVPYRGKFGVGKIIIQHCTRTHVIFEYWLLKRTTRDENKN